MGQARPDSERVTHGTHPHRDRQRQTDHTRGGGDVLEPSVTKESARMKVNINQKRMKRPARGKRIPLTTQKGGGTQKVEVYHFARLVSHSCGHRGYHRRAKEGGRS